MTDNATAPEEHETEAPELEPFNNPISAILLVVIFILLAGRAPTTAEFDDLVARLDAETTTPTAIAQAIIDSPAYATKITG